MFTWDNFGTRTGATGNWRRHPSNDRLIRPLSYAPEEARVDPRTAPGADDEVFATSTELLSRFERQRIVGVAQLAAREARRREYRDPRWCEVVSVFVGKNFDARVAFWNSRHLMPAWLDDGMPSWRVSEEDLSNDDFVSALVEVIQRTGYVRSSGGGSIVVRFVSMASEPVDLDALITRLRGFKSWCMFESKRVATLDECAPSAESREHAHEVEGGRYPLGVGSRWVPVARSDHALVLPPCMPLHVEEIPKDTADLRRGCYAVDCDIVRSNNLSQFGNVADKWRLPRRLRTASAFARPSGGLRLAPRAQRSGLLTIYANVDEIPYGVVEPDDEQAIATGLTARDGWPTERPGVQRLAGPPSRAFATRRSDCGKYLTGVLHQFGGLHCAQSYMLHEYWSAQFAKLGASVLLHDHMIGNVVNKLKKVARTNPQYDLNNEERRRDLAVMALREASQERRSIRCLGFNELEADFATFCDEYSARHPSQDPESSGDEERGWMESLGQSVQYLCTHQVLHQGYEWKCRQCLHKNWIGLDALRREIECAVCGATTSAPVSRHWEFRLNEFVHRSVRDHGVLPVLWTLAALQDRYHSAPMYFLGPTWLYVDEERYDSNTPNAELDLLVVLGTEVMLVEAKNSVRDFRPEKLCFLAERIRPNRILIAIREAKSPVIEARTQEVRDGVRDLPVAVELLTSDDWGGPDEPWLPAGKEGGLVRLRLF
jgi:hypothetical protein